MDLCTRNAAVIRELAGASAPIWAGAHRPLLRPLVTALDYHGPEGLGDARPPLPASGPEPGHAVEALIRHVMAAPGAVTVVALGPLTNLALALRLEPRLAGAIGRLVVMGGALRVPGNTTPHAEFNVFVDPHAAAIVLDAGLPLTLVPLDATRQVRLTPAGLAELAGRAPGSPVMRFAGDVVAPHMRGRPGREPGFVLHDPLALAIAVDPGVADTEPLDVSVVLDGEEAGRTVPRFGPGGAALAARKVDAGRVQALLGAALARLAGA